MTGDSDQLSTPAIPQISEPSRVSDTQPLAGWVGVASGGGAGDGVGVAGEVGSAGADGAPGCCGTLGGTSGAGIPGAPGTAGAGIDGNGTSGTAVPGRFTGRTPPTWSGAGRVTSGAGGATDVSAGGATAGGRTPIPSAIAGASSLNPFSPGPSDHATPAATTSAAPADPIFAFTPMRAV